MSFTGTQAEALRAVCDTFFPAVPRDPDPGGFFARRASDLGVDAEVAAYIDRVVPEPGRSGLKQLLDVLAGEGFGGLDQVAREQMLAGFAAFGPEVKAGVDALRALTLLHAYALPDNPNWRVSGYPGPRSAPPAVPKPIRPLIPTDADLELTADAVVVGSGAGGGVIAARLAEAGRSVVIVERGEYRNEADFDQLELPAYEHLYYKRGLPTTSDGTVTLLCGQNLGGGTTVNWMNCVLPSRRVRREWADEHGLDGVDGPDFDRHLATVMARIKANQECSDFNGPHQRMAEGAAALGWSLRRAMRNTDPQTYDPASAGYVHFGDQTGSRQGTLATYLRDAVDGGARVVVETRADRILVERGRAVGVVGVHEPSGRRVVVRAPVVVVACGALESPALLLRSGIGGPAVGKHLRLHPGGAIAAVYADDQRPWWGPPQAAILDHHADLGDGYGFLVEGGAYAPGLSAAVTPWRNGAEHKDLMSLAPKAAGLVFFVRDRGAGEVTLGPDGEARQTYPMSDPEDRRVFRAARAALVRLHAAAGALKMHIGAGEDLLTWRRGDDLDGYLARLEAVEFGDGRMPVFSAHQMGSCRMGRDPQTSVADPRGELHDVRGVWIGDGSAFPSAAGVNPMLTIMALAERTAGHILANEPAGAG